jgi:hypothetical protein
MSEHVPPRLSPERRKIILDMAQHWGIQIPPHDTDQLDLIGEIGQLDHKNQPGRLAELHAAGRLAPATLNYLVPSTWRYRIDGDPVPVQTWRELFQAVDYTHDFSLARRPRWPVRLYRGATEANRYGLAWTWRIDQATYFAHSRQAPGTHASVWTVLAPPERLLAYLSDEGEFVTDVRGLEVRPHDPQTPSPWWTRHWPHRRGARPLARARARH